MQQISVVGAGTMGRGIAYTAALSGFRVKIYDIDEANLEQGRGAIEELLQKSTDRGFIDGDQAEVAKRQIVYENNLREAVCEADVVIEAVLEEIPLKVKIFRQLDEHCPNHTVLATNTSTLSPTEIGAATHRPEKVIAMHFFNPVHKMKLIEMIKGLDTSEETVRIVQDLGEKMNKETVEVNEFPGFVTSRMNCLIGNEAMNMYMEGVASAEDIDKALKLGLNHPMGPLELADLVGLDSRLRNMNYLYETLGEKYRPCPLLIKYVKAGKLGRKSGEGFYKYH
ncbi:3-hydroxyacyl-CoA dehydrogenase [Salicibibacter cibarius]|uniref:3-hydroxyacyl-CoA dehydrogenase n=1 Tax=Salicibibacter cibarius TaxID=2743000 RepID=A0A7T6Z657_9BACI|nr:3-hydroxyacyl-CoA dehydrogenase NAD-binding domain-containing protein [Salicibibacter cibarius]QQK77427.1 3-hydroxyacyl-CoA dehydrogenase [Salicibibacter cibarius]